VAVWLAVLRPPVAHGVALDALDVGRDWRLRALRFHGTSALPTRAQRAALVTRPRPWFTPWRPLPPFDPIAFRTDLERLRRLYESRGFYHARLEADVRLPVDDGDAVTVLVAVTEGLPLRVATVDVEIAGDPLPVAEPLALAAGQVFTEDAYERTRTQLATAYRQRSYARVEVAKHALVDLERDEVRVDYRVTTGPPCVFGEVRISGALTVGAEVVRRELAFAAGDPYAPGPLETTRRNLTALNLFRVVRIEEDRGSDPRVNVYVRVEEAPPRDVRLGVGYDTDEGPRGLAAWRDYDFAGGARQLGFTARVSPVRRIIAADFLQPHFPAQAMRARLLLSEERLVEDPFTLARTRLSPRLEWSVTPRLIAFGDYRAEYDSLSSVPLAVQRALPGGDPANSVLSALGLGVEWNATDDLIDPSRGALLSASVEPAGGVLGGDLSFVRAVLETRAYWPLLGRLEAATRVRLGAAQPFGNTPEIPLFERFYAGGINSVRGYARWDVGPRACDPGDRSPPCQTTANNDPIGGRSLIETSLELRHPVTDTLGLVTFLDAGQASRTSLTFPFHDLQRGVGGGIRYRTPVGPLRVDIGIPLDRRRGDAAWQLHVSVGPAF